MQLPIPKFFNPANADVWGFEPDLNALRSAAVEWRKEHGITPGTADPFQIALMDIDPQDDFCNPTKGTLFVGGRSGTGAVDDNVRVASFIYRNLAVLSATRITLDTHFYGQIFFPEFWLTKGGVHPAPYTEISLQAFLAGDFKPNPAIAAWVCNGNYPWLRSQVEFYLRELEKSGRYKLTVWPPHCVLGSKGHALSGIIQEARMFHAYVRNVPALAEIKGGNPLSEHYSAFGPEVLMRFDGKPLAQKNTRFLEALLEFSAVIIAGQAASHCVAWTIADLLGEITAKDAKLAKKVYIMTDCTSAVAVPDGQGGFYADYTDEAEAAFAKFADAGMHLVKSTDPIASWPGIRL